ncbi:Etoposide-induced 2.4 family protein [Pseudohyphozyma bogoriensis]|nr:Etoposide-induced 2.4 family protein [Pseudohyphozyma bogoriensis]
MASFGAYPNNQGVYGRGTHTRAASSIGFSVLPPLSVPDTLLLHARFVSSIPRHAQTGLKDAFKIESVIETLATNKLVAANTLKSSLLQVVVLLSALVFKPLLGRVIPNDHSSRQATSGIVYILFHILWLYPLAAAAVYYSGLLNAPALPDRRGGRGGGDYRGMTATVIMESYKALVLVNYLIVMAQWMKSGWPLDERVKHLDSRWAYFIGFGFPITLLSWWSSDPVVNLAMFSLFFPLFKTMTATAIAQPLDPNLPTSAMSLSFLPQAAGSSFSMAAAEGGEEARGRKGHPSIPIRIQVLFLADKVYAFLVKQFVGMAKKKDAAGPGYGAHHGHAGHAGHGGWRGDGAAQAAYGPPPTQQSAYSGMGGMGGMGMGGAPPQSYGVAQAYGNDPYGSVAGGGGMGSASAMAGAGGGFAQSPPRRGHVMTESTVGVGGGGGEFIDRNLDSLISQAGKRKKGD